MKLLALDIETAPSLVYTWSLYKPIIGINQIVRPGYIMCWCASWVGEKKIHWDSIFNYKKEFLKDSTNDRFIAQGIWDLMNDADVIIAQNGDAFDIKHLNSLFLRHNMPLPSPYRTIDTLKASRKHFYALSHKLDYRTQELGLEGKVRTGGFDLWEDCMHGDEKAWKLMIKYCKKDVDILKEYYEKMKPYITNHPNIHLGEGETKCGSCGSSALVRKQGFMYTNTGKFQTYQCSSCNKWWRGYKNVLLRKVSNRPE